jgi:Nucleotidyltransferase of unknown function (DUF6036)
MTKNQLEDLLRRAGELARDRDFFLIGSQAIRGVCAVIPRDFPKTREADLYPQNHPQAWAVLRRKLGKGSSFHHRKGYFPDCADPALSTIPDGWLDRLIPFRTPHTGGITAWCLEPHDLFVAKLVAFREKDMLFLKAMLRHKLVKQSRLFERIAALPFHEDRMTELETRLAQLLKAFRAERRRRTRI